MAGVAEVRKGTVRKVIIYTTAAIPSLPGGLSKCLKTPQDKGHYSFFHKIQWWIQTFR